MNTHIAQPRHLGRAALAATAALIVVWSFVRVGTRPWRRSPGRPEATPITVLHWGGHLEDAVVEMLKRDFEAANPGIRIRRINAEADYFAKLRTMMAAGEPPDVMFLNGSHVPAYASRGLLLPADELTGDDRLNLDDFYPETLRAFRFDGTVAGRGTLWGLPASVTPLGFYYNRDLFDRAGVAYPTDDWTWHEFADKARTIGRIDGVWGAEYSLLPATVRVLLWTEGLDLFSPELDRPRWQDLEVRRVLERLRDWRFGAGRILIDAGSQVVSGRDHFLAGKVGMYGPSGRWLVPTLRQIDGFAWEFAQLPRGRRRANTMFVAAWCVAAGSEHPAAARAVARHFASAAAQRANVATGLALPALKSVAESPAFLDPEVRPRRDDLFLAAMSRARAMRWPVDSQIDSFAARRFDDALGIGTATLDRSLASLAADWQAEQRSPLRRGDFPAMPWRAILAALLATAVGLLLILARRLWPGRSPSRRGTGPCYTLGPAGREELAGLAFISPWIVGLIVFILIPAGLSLLLSLTRWSGITSLDQARWVGLGNYLELARDPRLLSALRLTLLYVVLAVPAGQLSALAAALLLTLRRRGTAFFRAAWYLPTVLTGVGVAMLWRWVFDGDYGLLNRLLAPLCAIAGVAPPDWLGADAGRFGVPAFAIMSVWLGGGTMLIYLAGLRAIPRSLYEAAEIAGAGRARRFFTITLPLLSPVILFNTVVALIGSFQVFTQAYVMTRGGPGDLTRFYVLYLYDQAFEYHEMGYASAMAWLLLACVLALTLVLMRMTRRLVFYTSGPGL